MVGGGKVEADGKEVESDGRKWMAGGGKVNAGRKRDEVGVKNVEADGRRLMVGGRRMEAGRGRGRVEVGRRKVEAGLVGEKVKRMWWWMGYKNPRNEWLFLLLESRQQESVELVWLQTGLWLAGGDQWKDWQLQLTVDNAVWPLVLQDSSS